MESNHTTKKMLARRHAPAALATLLLCAAGASATILHVPGDYTTVAAAVAAAQIGDTVSIGKGGFTAHLVFTKSVTLAGAGSTVTVLNGGGNGTVLTTTPGVTLTVRDLTVRDGKAPDSFGSGGGVLNDGDIHMERCVIRDCQALTAGGALDNVNGIAHLVDCYFYNNQAGFAGGAINNSASLEMEGCTLSENEADTGGALINTGSLSITNCTVYRNTAHHGGGLYVHSGTTAVEYSTLNENDGGSDGGGVLSLAGFRAHASIIAGNKATGGADVLGELDSSGYNLIGTNEGANIVPIGGAGPDQVGTPGLPLPPLLVWAPDNGGPTPVLVSISSGPAVDHGDPAAFPAWDQRGVHRPRAGYTGRLLPDVGSVELGPIGYTADDLHRALQIAAGMTAADSNDAWLDMDKSHPGVDLLDCAHLARKAMGLE